MTGWSLAYFAALCARVLAFGSHAAAPTDPPPAQAEPDVTAPGQPAPSVIQPSLPGSQQPPPPDDRLRTPGNVPPSRDPAPQSPPAHGFLALPYLGVAAHAEAQPAGMLP